MLASPRVGQLLARVLVGSWRREPPPPSLSEAELAEIAAPLIRSGAGALAWWHIRHSALRSGVGAAALRQEYFDQSVRAARRIHELQRIARALKEADIKFILFKGWAVAQHYAEPGLRPSSDFDLLVRPAQYPAAEASRSQLRLKENQVDLHITLGDTTHAPEFYADVDELFARAQCLALGDIEIAVLSPEDHLALICLHFLRHGGWRPLWLCDVAATLEARPPDFDWARCLGPAPYADRIACTIGLAHQLLGADLTGVPLGKRGTDIPRWFTQAVLDAWATPEPEQNRLTEPVRAAWRQPRRLGHAVRQRWRNPIQATVALNAAFDDTPRVLYQVVDFVSTVTRFFVRGVRPDRTLEN